MERSTVAPLLGGLVAICFALEAAAQSATATLAPTAGNTAAGKVSFTQKGDKVTVTAEVWQALRPAGTAFISTKKAIAARQTA